MGLFNSMADGIGELGRTLDPMAQLFPEWGDIAHDDIPDLANEAVATVIEPFDDFDKEINPFRNESSPLYIEGIAEFQDEVADRPVTAVAMAVGAMFGGAALAGGGGAAAGSGAAAGAGEVGAGIWGAGQGGAAAASSGALGAGEMAAIGSGASGGGSLLSMAETGLGYAQDANKAYGMYQQATATPPTQKINFTPAANQVPQSTSQGGGYRVKGGYLI